MRATKAFTQQQAIMLRCVACRYFVYERCSHSTARLDGDDSREDECRHFRFAQSHAIAVGF